METHATFGLMWKLKYLIGCKRTRWIFFIVRTPVARHSWCLQSDWRFYYTTKLQLLHVHYASVFHSLIHINGITFGFFLTHFSRMHPTHVHSFIVNWFLSVFALQIVQRRAYPVAMNWTCKEERMKTNSRRKQIDVVRVLIVFSLKAAHHSTYCFIIFNDCRQFYQQKKTKCMLVDGRNAVTFIMHCNIMYIVHVLVFFTNILWLSYKFNALYFLR